MKRSGAQPPWPARPAGPLCAGTEVVALLPRPARVCGCPSRPKLYRALRRDNVTVVPEGFDPPGAGARCAQGKSGRRWSGARLVPYKPRWMRLRYSRSHAGRSPTCGWDDRRGPDLEKVQAAATDGVTGVRRVSEQEKVRPMAAAHVHIATSVREGWGLVVTEAAAVGTPTVAYDVPGPSGLDACCRRCGGAHPRWRWAAGSRR